jgi:SAM-dependent methyltransferase
MSTGAPRSSRNRAQRKDPERPGGPYQVAGYGTDLAYIHDVGFSSHAAHASAFLIARLPRRSFVIDIGCGSGTTVAALTDAGHRVLGIDLSPSMLTLARKKAPRARFRRASMWRARIPPCEAVSAVGEVFNHQFDGKRNEDDLGRLFARVHRALRKGGIFLFDLAGPGRARRLVDPTQFWGAPGWAMYVTRSERGHLLERSIVTYRRFRRHERTSGEVHRLRLFQPRKVLALLRRAGFAAVERLDSYGDKRFPRGLTGYLARKASEPPQVRTERQRARERP